MGEGPASWRDLPCREIASGSLGLLVEWASGFGYPHPGRVPSQWRLWPLFAVQAAQEGLSPRGREMSSRWTAAMPAVRQAFRSLWSTVTSGSPAFSAIAA
jgi:hypothetical protein